VLQASDQSMLTLITCYPFTYIGPAPKRFVVRAERSLHQETHRGHGESENQEPEG
jgi:LPXTG-site transpeptidase (sortase) family protein